MAENKKKKTLTISTSFNKKKLNETNFRPKEKQSFIPEKKKNNRTFWGQLGKIDRTLDFLETNIINWSNPVGFDAANISLATALDYMSFRNVRDWRLNRPKISQWFDVVSSKLPGFTKTAPKS